VEAESNDKRNQHNKKRVEIVMRRLAKWTAITLLLSITLLGSAVLYGRTAPKSYLFLAKDVDLCDGELCFMGIAPGKTLWSDATKQFEDGTIDNYPANWFRVSRNDIYLEFKQYSDDPKNLTVELLSVGTVNYRSLVNFGYIIERFGTPCFITDMGLEGGGLFQFEYPYFRLIVALNSIELGFQSKVVQLTIWDPSDPSVNERFCNVEMRPPTLPWLGFASFKRYQSYLDQYLKEKYGENIQ
jgi:hypothetical protein